MSEWRRAWSIGRRDLDWRFRGLRLLFVSLLLGVAALAAVGSLAAAMERGLATRGAELLGGDVEFARSGLVASDQERAPFERAGRVAQSIRMTSTAIAGTRSIPIQLKAVDQRYPLYGALTLADGRRVGAPAAGTVWIDAALADRLPVGSAFRLGRASMRVAGVLGNEPDRLSEGFALAPSVMIALDDLPATGLDQPGSLFEVRYRIATGADPAALLREVKRDFPAAGWEAKTRDNAAPGAGRFVGRMAEFLTLVVLAALVIAGVGIANAVTSFLAARQPGIAVLKVLGATAPLVRRIYAIQIGWTALLATAIGLVVGVAAVPIVGAAAANLLPIPLDAAPAWPALALAAAFGLLTAIAAAALPLTRAAILPPAALLRGALEARRGGVRAALPWIALPAAAILALAILLASRPWLTAGFLGAVAAVLLLLAGLGLAVRWIAARLPRPKTPFARLALAGLHRPGSGTVGLVVALGVGLTMFVLIAAVRSSFEANLRGDIAGRAPGLVVLDIPRERAGALRALVARAAPAAEVSLVPLLRGTITGYGTTNVADLETLPDNAWALRGERGLTYADALPPGSSLTAGRWWRPGYAGPPLVSVDERLGQALGLKLGDELRFSLFGVERAARIASFRRIDWETLGFNFVLVFSPNALADVPHNLSATIGLERSQAGAVRAAIAADFPASSVIEVGSVLDELDRITDGISMAIGWAAAVAVLAGIAVLAGTAAAMRAARAYDAVLLRVLGATRRQLLALQAFEFALLALIVSAVALALGLAAGWLVITRLFDMRWSPDPAAIAATLGSGVAVVLIVGLLVSLPSLAERPARVLRAL